MFPLVPARQIARHRFFHKLTDRDLHPIDSPSNQVKERVEMTQRAMIKAGTVLLTVSLLLSVLHTAESVPLSRPQRRMLRLCSRSLSDALYLVCLERGYNEPFSYSGEDEPRVDHGQGLVEECCYHSCTYEQLEQYCKPIPEEKREDSVDDM